MKIPNLPPLVHMYELSLARIVSEDSQRRPLVAVGRRKSSKDS